MCQNLAFSFSLYTGQMCTAPQNVYLPAAGIETDEGVKTPAEVAAGIGAALEKLLGDDARAVELLGGVVNAGVLERLERGRLARRGAGRLAHGDPPGVPRRDGAHAHARRADGDDADVYESECFGPVAYLIATAGTDESIDLFRDTVQRARRDDRRGLLHLRRRGRRDARGRPRRRRRAVARTCSAGCSSTSPRRTPTSTAPAPTRPPTRRTPTAPTWRRGSGWSSPAATSDARPQPAPLCRDLGDSP